MKVYIVEHQETDFNKIEGVFATRELAEAYIFKLYPYAKTFDDSTYEIDFKRKWVENIYMNIYEEEVQDKLSPDN